MQGLRHLAAVLRVPCPVGQVHRSQERMGLVGQRLSVERDPRADLGDRAGDPAFLYKIPELLRNSRHLFLRQLLEDKPKIVEFHTLHTIASFPEK